MEENLIYFYTITSVFSILLILAAIFDVWKFVIPNFISVGIVVLFFVASSLIPMQTYWLSHLGAASATFVMWCAKSQTGWSITWYFAVMLQEAV